MVMRYAPLSELSSEVRIVDGKLVIGTKEVDTTGFPLTENKVPTLFLIRVKGEEHHGYRYWNLVTGFDLVKGGFWLGGCTIKHGYGNDTSIPSATFQWWSQVERILDHMCLETKGKEWSIFVEGECYASEKDLYESKVAEAQAELDRLTEES